MRLIYFVTHPDVRVDAGLPVHQWQLSARGHRRMRSLLRHTWTRRVRAIFCSTERKAIDGARILGGHLGLAVEEIAGLGEIDRSATGYLPKDEFEAVVDEFFAQPERSVRGWERGTDARQRIVMAMRDVLSRLPSCGDAVVVAHGAVGALYISYLRQCAISRIHDQPATNGGNYFVIDAEGPALRQGWTPIDA
jgi:broad specificity phosphatase PhoE